jgi:hypothetical protein
MYACVHRYRYMCIRSKHATHSVCCNTAPHDKFGPQACGALLHACIDTGTLHTKCVYRSVHIRIQHFLCPSTWEQCTHIRIHAWSLAAFYRSPHKKFHTYVAEIADTLISCSQPQTHACSAQPCLSALNSLRRSRYILTAFSIKNKGHKSEIERNTCVRLSRTKCCHPATQRYA